MVNLYEVKLINTFYNLSLEEEISFESVPYPTICPEVLATFLSQNAVPYWTPCNKWLYCISREDLQQKDNPNAPFQYALTEDMYMFRELQNAEISMLDWLKRYWKVPFLITHPFHVCTTDPTCVHIFSTSYARCICLNSSTELLEKALDNGCFSMGNGLILGLTMVALGRWKENEFLLCMDMLIEGMEPKPIDKTLPFYMSLYGDWCTYTEMVPYSIIDHVFGYAFQFTFKRVYSYFYKVCKSEDYLTYHISTILPKAYISSIFQDVSSREQFLFLYEKRCIQQQYKQAFAYFPSVRLHLNFYTFIRSILNRTSLFRLYMSSNVIQNQLQYLLSLSPPNAYQRILQTCLSLEKTVPRRRVALFYRHFMKLFPKNTLDTFFLQLLQTILQKKKGHIVQFPSKKWCRLHIFQNTAFLYSSSVLKKFITSKEVLSLLPFPYTSVEEMGEKERIHMKVTWKEFFAWIEQEGGPSYSTMMVKRIVKKLKTVKKMVEPHPESHVLSFLMQEHYRTHPEELWK